MTDDVPSETVAGLREHWAALEQELDRVMRERDAALRELAAAAGQAAVVARRGDTSDLGDADGTELCAFCDGEGTYWVHDFEMKCRRCEGSGYAKRQANPLPVSER